MATISPGRNHDRFNSDKVIFLSVKLNEVLKLEYSAGNSRRKKDGTWYIHRRTITLTLIKAITDYSYLKNICGISDESEFCKNLIVPFLERFSRKSGLFALANEPWLDQTARTCR